MLLVDQRKPREPVMERRSWKIAIVGGGPRGLFALEELSNAARGISSDVFFEVSIFDPVAQWGAGNVYHPDQPEYLRMNFSTEHVCAWSELSLRSNPDSNLDLNGWLTHFNRRFAGSGRFIPRSVTGRYLMDCFQTVSSSLPKNMELNLIPAEVRRIHRLGNSWTCEWDGHEKAFDETLIATGHGGWRPAEHEDSETGFGKVIAPVYPVDTQLSEETISPGAHVSVKGFSLTWIDAALALTEGRGGVFLGADLSQLVYIPSGREPTTISPFSRTGRPMLAKPTRSRMNLPDSLGEFWKDRRDILTKRHRYDRSVNFSESILPFLFEAADECLDLCGSTEGDSCRRWFAEWSGSTGSSPFLVGAMRESISVSLGSARVGPAWALGEAWRQLYPPIVRSIEHGKLSPEAYPDYLAFSGEMERIAFGPPVRNLARIIALEKAGIVDLSDPARKSPGADCVIDARIASPCDFNKESLLQQLLADGEIKRLHGRYGIAIDADARPLNHENQPVRGLSIIGRATEGSSIGNDTLSRTLNHHPARWARSICDRAATSQSPDSRKVCRA